jgi:isoleucyl-tRNA synthetase
VKEVDFGEVQSMQVTVKPNLPVLGPKLGSRLPELRRALEYGQWKQVDGGRLSVPGFGELSPDEFLVERTAPDGWAVAEGDGLAVALSTELDDDLRLEGRVLDLIHALNAMRKQAGLELTDRIRVTLPESQSDLLKHVDWIKDEVLAVEIETDGGAEPRIEKV